MEIISVSENLILDECARMMSSSEPWITLKRDFEKCRESLVGDFREVYGAFENDRVVGFIVLQMKGTFAGYLQTIFVMPGSQRKGVGKVLLKFAEEHIYKISPNVFLCASSFNLQAIKLYERCGYEKISVLKDFIVKGYDEILMRKTIGSWNEFKK